MQNSGSQNNLSKKNSTTNNQNLAKALYQGYGEAEKKSQSHNGNRVETYDGRVNMTGGEDYDMQQQQLILQQIQD
jgi:hypothetical protein